MNFNDAIGILIIVGLVLLGAWQWFWKGLALWRSARFDQRNWFIAFLILIPMNDFGIIEIVYLFRFAKKNLTLDEIRSWFKK